jgi:cyclic-di-GMP-binding protein
MKLDLPPTDSAQPPLFTDSEQCRAWLKNLPLLNPLQTQGQILEQLRLLNGLALFGPVRLKLLETLRETIYFAQGESAKKFSSKPLPLAPIEQVALDVTHGLWQALLMGYLRCLEGRLAGDTELTPQTALICQRALATLADDYADLVRAGRQPDSALWRFAHAIYGSAEILEVTTRKVADALRSDRPATPAAAYVELILLTVASLHELPPRQQGWVMRWARRWAGKVSILPAEPSSLASALPLCVDLESDAPPSFMPQSGSGARWLDTGKLRTSLKQRLTLLARGGPADTPASLGLGDDCQQPACGEVLQRIYPRWVKGGVQRRYERHPMSGSCRFVAGVEPIHYYVSGHQSFKPPGSASSDELRRQHAELELFGRVATRFEDDYSQDHGFQMESWTVVEDWGMFDQSEDGLRLVRASALAGGRLGIGQLVAVQPAGRSDMLLGVVRWTQLIGDGLATGVQLLPGRPQPVAVRRTGVMASPDEYQRGFLLPPLEARELPACLVLPLGGFKPERIMEVWMQIATRRFKLKGLIERGTDFERASCVEVA